MQRFKNILLVIDHRTKSKAALDQAVALCKRNQACLAVVDLVEDLSWDDVDLIVMGTVARTGVARFFISNTAESVLNKVDCSVLTVKPDDFVTPVIMDE